MVVDTTTNELDIEIEGLTYTYEGAGSHALKDISLRF